MTSDFHFTLTSWFPWNVWVKPYSKHSAALGARPLDLNKNCVRTGCVYILEPSLIKHMTKAYDFVACHNQFGCLDMAAQLFQEFRTRIQGLVKDSMYISECQFKDWVFQICLRSSFISVLVFGSCHIWHVTYLKLLLRMKTSFNKNDNFDHFVHLFKVVIL